MINTPFQKEVGLLMEESSGSSVARLETAHHFPLSSQDDSRWATLYILFSYSSPLAPQYHVVSAPACLASRRDRVAVGHHDKSKPICSVVLRPCDIVQYILAILTPFFTFTCPTSSLAESTIIRPICTVGPLRLFLYVPCGSDRASPDEPHEALRPKQQFPLAHRYHSTPGRSRHGGSASFLVAVSLCVESRFSIPVLLSETKQWLIVYVQSRPAPPPPTSR